MPAPVPVTFSPANGDTDSKSDAATILWDVSGTLANPAAGKEIRMYVDGLLRETVTTDQCSVTGLPPKLLRIGNNILNQTAYSTGVVSVAVDEGFLTSGTADPNAAILPDDWQFTRDISFYRPRSRIRDGQRLR